MSRKSADAPEAPYVPLLKWPGGKRRIALQVVTALYPDGPAPGVYREPFMGGGAVYLHLLNNGVIAPTQAVLSDGNAKLMTLYLRIQQDPEQVIARIRAMGAPSQEVYDEAVRRFEAGEVELLPWLNRAGFNGLYRESARTGYNVPRGNKFTPPNEVTIRQLHRALQGATVIASDFRTQLTTASSGDRIYLDPPYPGGFTAYTRGGFHDQDHRDLDALAHEAGQRGAYVVLSASDTDKARELYTGRQHVKLLAPRTISRDGAKRAPTPELLLTYGTL